MSNLKCRRIGCWNRDTGHEEEEDHGDSSDFKRSTVMTRETNDLWGVCSRRTKSNWLMLLLLLTVTYILVVEEANGSELRNYVLEFSLNLANGTKKNSSEGDGESYKESRRYRNTRKLLESGDGYGFVSAASNPYYIITGSNDSDASHSRRGPAYNINNDNKTTFNSSSNQDVVDLNYMLFLLNDDRRPAGSVSRSPSLPPPPVTTKAPLTSHVEKSTNSLELRSPFESIWQKEASSTEVPDSLRFEGEDRHEILNGDLPLFSTSLNVVDPAPENIQLAHSVLLVHRPNKHKTTIITRTTTTTTTTPGYPIQIKSNHGPMSKPYQSKEWYRPFKRKPVLTTTTTSTQKTMTDEIPILFSNNHRRHPYTPLTRHKLTSEYAEFWSTTPTAGTAYGETAWESISSTTPFSTITRPNVNIVTKPPTAVNHIHGNNIKSSDTIRSQVLTVLDPKKGTMRLPPNTTVIHRNVIVPYKPGRPRPAPATTTQYPYYPVVAHITKRPSQVHHASTQSIPVNDLATSATGSVSTYQSIHSFPVTQTVQSPLSSYPSYTTPTTIYVHTVRPPANPPYEMDTSQSIERPTINDCPYCSDSIHRPQHAITSQQIVAVTPISPIKQQHLPSGLVESQHFVVTTQNPPKQSQGFINAILAPPLPSRPFSTASSFLNPVSMGPLFGLFGPDSIASLFTRVSFMKMMLFTLLVLFLPPLALAAAISGIG